jgi:tetratricopeptide (TPR) repeat protein
MVMTAVARRRATLVSADAAGYSRLMAVDELATIQAIKIFREAAEQIANVAARLERLARPFETAEGDAHAVYLADGLAEDLITNLALWHRFPVIARNSTFTYKGQIYRPLGLRPPRHVAPSPPDTRGRRAGRRVTQPRRRARSRFGVRARASRPGPLPDAPAPLDRRPGRRLRRARRAPGAGGRLRSDGCERLPLPRARLLGTGQARRRALQPPPGGGGDPQLWTFHAGKQVVLWNAGRYEEWREAGERALEIDPDAAAATAYSNIAATSALLGDLPRARAALAETLRAWPNMSIATLRALFASIPEQWVEIFFDGLRVAGWEPEEEDAPSGAPATS